MWDLRGDSSGASGGQGRSMPHLDTDGLGPSLRPRSQHPTRSHPQTYRLRRRGKRDGGGEAETRPRSPGAWTRWLAAHPRSHPRGAPPWLYLSVQEGEGRTVGQTPHVGCSLGAWCGGGRSLSPSPDFCFLLSKLLVHVHALARESTSMGCGHASILSSTSPLHQGLVHMHPAFSVLSGSGLELWSAT